MKKIINAQFLLLLIATVFAWTNFFREFVDWLNNQSCETGCTASGDLVNPFLTPCFYGAVFFSLALVLSLLMMFLSREKKKKPKQEPSQEQESREDNNEN